MHTIILIGGKKGILESLVEETVGEPCRILYYPSLLDLYPDVLTHEPLVALIDGKVLSENELGVITLLKKTFHYLKILIYFPPNLRDLCAKSITFGADAYVLEPFFLDEMADFISHAFENAKGEKEQSLDMRMKALSLFIQGLAPEINNCLTPIMGAIQLLQGKEGSDLEESERQENYRYIYNESLRIARTVKELENFARPRRPKKNSVSLRETLEKAVGEALQDSRNEVPIENDFHGDPNPVLIDQSQIVFALAAIMRFLKENADEERGKIVISTHTPGQGKILIDVWGHDTVSLGEEANNAFIPLYLRNIVRFGHELGLASAYGLIRANKGQVEIETIKKGTGFHVSIPIE